MRCNVGMERGVSVTHSPPSSCSDLSFRKGKGLGKGLVREPHFPVRVLGMDGRRPVLYFKNWEREETSLCWGFLLRGL